MALKVIRAPGKAGFEIGLVLRLALLLVVVPWPYEAFFLPFLTYVGHAPSIDLWDAFLEQGGRLDSFPYGPLYLLVYWPLTALGQSIAGAEGARVGLSTTVFLLDLVLFWLLRRHLRSDQRHIVTVFYWLSPIVLYVNYWHGQLDALPTLLLAAGVFLIVRDAIREGGFLVGLSAAAKFSMAAALPFVGMYILSERRLIMRRAGALAGLLLGTVVLAPFAISEGFRRMVFATPETSKLFALQLSFGDAAPVYLTPIAILGFLYASWRLRPFDGRALTAFVGIIFVGIYIFTPSPPGWALWFIPFVVAHLVSAPVSARVTAFLFSIFVVLHSLFVAEGPLLFGIFDFSMPAAEKYPNGGVITSILKTPIVVIGGVTIYQMFRQNILESSIYQATRRPVLLAIAGDSGAGKDTLSDALRDIFGAQSTATLCGDDYHIWDRNKPMWRALTHLNPAANHIDAFSRDVLALSEKKTVLTRHYDHAVGRMTKPFQVRSKPFLVVSGLHALYPPAVLDRAHLKIFLDMDEDLREKLKIMRDVEQRGHLKDVVEQSIARRRPDGDRYIYPQKAAADIVFRLTASQGSTDGGYELFATFARAFHVQRLEKILVALEDADVTLKENNDLSNTLHFTAWFSRGAFPETFKILCPNLSRLCDPLPIGREQTVGLMQICVAYALEQKLFKERGSA